MQMRDYLQQSLPEGFSLTDEQLRQLDLYFKLLKEWNEKINLTAITDAQGVAVKHFADSLSLLPYVALPQGCRVADVGTGAGFPGVVLKIVRPDIQLTLLDSLKKRFLFLEDLLQQLRLEADFAVGRAEEYGQNLAYRESYNIVVSRAVANLNTLRVLSAACQARRRLCRFQGQRHTGGSGQRQTRCANTRRKNQGCAQL